MEKAVLRKLTTLCIVCGLAAIVLFGVAAVNDGNREWKLHQAQYKAELLSKLSRDRNPALYERIANQEPWIRQIVVGEWNTVDRCTTCHLGIDDPLFAGSKQPLRNHPRPDLLKQHPVEKYGCTICHGGQGLATTYYGSSHKTIDNWPVSLVGKGLLQSRCGYCHKDFEAIGADRLIKGRELYTEMHCAGCHQINGQGGAVGPDLSGFADKDPSNFSFANLEGGHSKENWVIEHFKDPKRVSPGSPMRSYAMNDEQIECLASYVLSLTPRDFTRPFTPRMRAGFVPPRLDVIPPEAGLSASGEDEANGTL